MTDSIKVNFRLQPDEDDYPPVSVESLWASPIGGNRFKIDSIPFFTSEATVSDVIYALPDSQGSLWFDAVDHPSQRSLIRVVLFHSDQAARIAAKLHALGCGTEGFVQYSLIAVDVPVEVDLSDVQACLAEEVDAGHIDFEEALLRH